MNIHRVLVQHYLSVFPRPSFADQDKNRLSGACADINGLTVISLLLYVLQNVWTKVSTATTILWILSFVFYLLVERWAIFKGWARATVLTYATTISLFWMGLTYIAVTIAHTQSMILCIGLAYTTIALGPRYGFGVLLGYTGLLWWGSFIVQANQIPGSSHVQILKQFVTALCILTMLYATCSILRQHLITAIRIALNERDEARNTLELANQRLSELLAEKSSQLRERMEMAMLSMGTLAHEFRTPIASMNMSNAYMLDAVETARVDSNRFHPLLKNIEVILSRMNRHIDTSMVNVGVLLKDQLQPPVNRVDIGAIVRDALEVNKVAFSKAGPIQTRIADDCWTRADGTMFEHVVVNLLSNAITALNTSPRHYEGPQIEIDLFKNDTQITLRISDHGAGIRPELLERIYEPFYSSSSGTPSHGLGLTVVKKAIMAMGGTIRCTSEVGVGTTFEIFLDQYETSATPTPMAGWISDDRRLSKRPELTLIKLDHL